jgi:hypothetical protein
VPQRRQAHSLLFAYFEAINSRLSQDFYKTHTLQVLNLSATSEPQAIRQPLPDPDHFFLQLAIGFRSRVKHQHG